jgi:hypothetical protein
MADREFLVRLSKQLADEGKLMEAGWVGYRLGVLPLNAPAIQLDECKMAFFAGALHLFSSIMNILDEDAEPTEADLDKMDKIHREMAAFTDQLELRIKKPGGSA